MGENMRVPSFESVLPPKLAQLVIAQRTKDRKKALILGAGFATAGLGLLTYMLIHSLSRSRVSLNGELLGGLAIGLGFVAIGAWFVWGGKDDILDVLHVPGNPVVKANVVSRGGRRALMLNLRRGDFFPVYILPNPPDLALEAELLASLSTSQAPPAEPEPKRALVREVPTPDMLKLVDETTKAINITVLVVGSGAKELVRSCLEGMGTPPAGTASKDEMEYASVDLGAVRAWRTRLHFYAFDSHFDGTVAAGGLAPTTTVLLAQRERGSIDPALVAMGNRALGHASLLFVLASSEARRALREEAGINADYEAAYDTTQALATMKEITTRVLKSLKQH